jgi:hypothetical protein
MAELMPPSSSRDVALAAAALAKQHELLSEDECIVCLDAPRGPRFDCGHCVCCSTCAQQLKRCPMCREKITMLSLNDDTFFSDDECEGEAPDRAAQLLQACNQQSHACFQTSLHTCRTCWPITLSFLFFLVWLVVALPTICPSASPLPCDENRTNLTVDQLLVSDLLHVAAGSISNVRQQLLLWVLVVISALLVWWSMCDVCLLGGDGEDPRPISRDPARQFQQERARRNWNRRG